MGIGACDLTGAAAWHLSWSRPSLTSKATRDINRVGTPVSHRKQKVGHTSTRDTSRHVYLHQSFAFYAPGWETKGGTAYQPSRHLSRTKEVTCKTKGGTSRCIANHRFRGPKLAADLTREATKRWQLETKKRPSRRTSCSLKTECSLADAGSVPHGTSYLPRCNGGLSSPAVSGVRLPRLRPRKIGRSNFRKSVTFPRAAPA